MAKKLSELEFKKDKKKDVEEVSTETSDDVCGFEQAFRRYKKEHPEACSWTVGAVELFASKQVKAKISQFSDWCKAFNSY